MTNRSIASLRATGVARSRLDPTVEALGVVSLLNDLSSKAEARSVTSGKVSGSFSSWRRDGRPIRGLSKRVLNFRKLFQAFSHPRHTLDQPLLLAVIRFTSFHLWHVWCTYLPKETEGATKGIQSEGGPAPLGGGLQPVVPLTEDFLGHAWKGL